MKKYLALLFLFHQVFADDSHPPESNIEELANLPIEKLLEIKITSIATGTKKTVSEAPAIASIITAREIKMLGATTLEEVLETVPGLHVSRTEVYAYKYQFRGISTKFDSQVLVMINNIPITSILANARNARLGILPLKMISRIEIIRGPGSALYGANAVAGVINVITKNSSDIDGTEIGVGTGSFDTHEAWYLHGKNYGDLKTSLMMTYQNTNGQRREITEDSQTRLDKALGTRASLAPGPVNLSEKRIALFLEAELENWKLRGSFHDLSNVGTGQGIAEAIDPNGKFNLNRTTLDLTYNNSKLLSNWDLTSQLAYYHGSQQVEKLTKIFPNGSNLGNGNFPNGISGNPEFWERQIRFDNSGLFEKIENHHILIGAGYLFADLYRVQESRNFDPNNGTPLPVLTNVTGTNGSFIPEKSRTSFYSYIQDEWRLIKNWEFTGGIRYDHYTDFGGTANPRAALVWKTNSDLTTKFLFGQAFRAPSFAELYVKNNPVTLGNPNLKPERISEYEMAWSYQIKPFWFLNLNLFYYKATDIIKFVKDASGLSATAQNFGTQTGNGFEIETNYKISSDLSVMANYSFVKAIDKFSRKSSGEFPTHKIYAREDWMFMQNWQWGAQATWIGDRERIPSDTRTKLAGYTSVDMNLRRSEIFKKCDITISMRNIFNTDIREPSLGPGPTSTSASIQNDLPQAGRSIDAALTYNF